MRIERLRPLHAASLPKRLRLGGDSGEPFLSRGFRFTGEGDCPASGDSPALVVDEFTVPTRPEEVKENSMEHF